MAVKHLVAWRRHHISAEQIDQVFRMEDMLTIDTANNALLTRYLARSAGVRLQWETRL